MKPKKIYERLSHDDRVCTRVYEIALWGKTLQVSHILTDSINAICIDRDLTDNNIYCPKCNIIFDPQPDHGDTLACACGETFTFHGSLDPEPVGKTYNYVQQQMIKQGVKIKETKLCDMCQNIASVSLGERLMIMTKSVNSDRERLSHLCERCFRDLFIDRIVEFSEFRSNAYEVTNR